MELKSSSTQDRPDEELEGEPSVTKTLKVEESIVSVGAVFVQGPGRLVGRRGHGHVVNHGDSHAGVGLQTEYHYGGTDEENRNDANSLQ